MLEDLVDELPTVLVKCSLCKSHNEPGRMTCQSAGCRRALRNDQNRADTDVQRTLLALLAASSQAVVDARRVSSGTPSGVTTLAPRGASDAVQGVVSSMSLALVERGEPTTAANVRKTHVGISGDIGLGKFPNRTIQRRADPVAPGEMINLREVGALYRKRQGFGHTAAMVSRALRINHPQRNLLQYYKDNNSLPLEWAHPPELIKSYKNNIEKDFRALHA